MAIALVQQDSNGTSGDTTLGVVLPGTIAAGNLLVYIVTGTAAHVSSISGGGVTWLLAKQSALTSYGADIWYGMNTSGGGTSATGTFTGSTAAGANLSEWSGLLTSGVLDASTSTSAATSTTPTPGSITAASPGPVLYIATMARAAATSVSSGPTNSFTAMTTSGGGGVIPNVPAYRIDTSTPAAANPSWTLAGSVPWEMTIAAFRAAAVSITDPGWTLGLGYP